MEPFSRGSRDRHTHQLFSLGVIPKYFQEFLQWRGYLLPHKTATDEGLLWRSPPVSGFRAPPSSFRLPLACCCLLGLKMSTPAWIPPPDPQTIGSSWNRGSHGPTPSKQRGTHISHSPSWQTLFVKRHVEVVNNACWDFLGHMWL